MTCVLQESLWLRVEESVGRWGRGCRETGQECQAVGWWKAVRFRMDRMWGVKGWGGKRSAKVLPARFWSEHQEGGVAVT